MFCSQATFFTLEKVSGLFKHKDVCFFLFSLKIVVFFHWIHILCILNSLGQVHHISSFNIQYS